MDIENGTDGLAESNVHLWQWHGGQNQRFWIEPLEKPPVDERELFVNRVIQENSSFGGKAVGELINKPQYMYGSWCARFIWNMAKEAGCEYAIPSGYDSAKNLPEAIKNNGGKLWSWKDVADGKYVPRAGDIIVYGESVYENGKNMNWAHVGVITECAYDQKTGKPSSFKTIEGNTSVGKDKKGNTLLGINSKTRKVKNSKTGYTTTNGKNKQGQTKYWFIRYIVEPNF